MHANLVHGPGPQQDEPLRLAKLWQAIMVRAYEVWPQSHPQAGRRRWKEVVVVLRKGTAKTEAASGITAMEADPEAPVRCVGWDEDGQPIGAGLRSPYIPMIAFTSEQSEELAFSTLQSMLRSDACPLGAVYSVGEERITRADGGGLIRAMAGSPGARDGALTTFQHFDEPHRMTTHRHIQAYDTMSENLYKVAANDAWSFITSTEFEPGEGSLLEEIMLAVDDDIANERVDTDRLFIELSASEHYDLDDPEQRVAALEEASGLDFDSGLDWSDLWGIARRYDDPKTDRTYWARVWLNWRRSSDRKAVGVDRWDAARDARLGEAGLRPGEAIALGFDGSRFRDGTGLVAARLSDGYTKVLGYWEPGVTGPYSEIPRREVHDAVAEAFRRYRVVAMYPDPPGWDSEIADWQAAYGEKVVKPFHTIQDRKMTLAVYAFWVDLGGTEESPPSIVHDGDPLLRSHILAADRRPSKTWIDTDTRGWTIGKPDDGRKIDLHVCAVLAHEARRDAIAAGAGMPTDSKEPNLW
ncbi:MAG: terminase [Actinomycetota bacterium]